jgi:hypothetical protein
LYPAIASACPCIRHQFRLLRCVSQAPGWGRATGEACRGIFGESSCPPSCKLQRPCCIPELTLELLTERSLFDPTTLASQLTSKPTMKGIQIKEYVKVHVPSIPPTNHPLTQPGTRRPQSPRPAHTHAQIRRVPNRHPRFGDQFLRPPPDPRQIPTPTRLPLGSWFRVLWRRPQSANRTRRRQDTQVQRGRQGLWRFARRLRNTHCLHRGAAQGRP